MHRLAAALLCALLWLLAYLPARFFASSLCRCPLLLATIDLVFWGLAAACLLASALGGRRP